MEYFSIKAFEHLLFPLHKSVYMGIDKSLKEIEKQASGAMECLVDWYTQIITTPTRTPADISWFVEENGVPKFDLCIDIREKNANKLRKTQNYITYIRNQEGESIGKGVHLIISTIAGNGRNAYMVPLPYVLQALEDQVTKPGAYQVYEHTLIRKNNSALGLQPTTLEEYTRGAGRYVGITRRSWQKRFQEHIYAANGRRSQLLFHRAMRGELFEVEMFEHEILRAGLTEDQALQIEEIEVEERTLNFIHPDGLNMIPGGRAGIRALANMRKKNINQIDPDKMEFELEEYVNETLRQPGIEYKKGYKNEKLAELWRSDIKFRIAAMTNSSSRISYKQILNARIWDAAGWPLEKILANLNSIDNRKVSENQLKMLLNGKTYATIPHVMINLD